MLAVYAAPARRIAAVLFLLAVGASSPASAIPIAVGGGWTNFSWVGGTGPIDTPADGYQFTSLTSVEVQITDCCVIGDRFEIFVNGASQGLTSAPVGSGPSGAFTGPASWAFAGLSKKSLVLGPGSYDIDIDVVSSVSTASSTGLFRVLSVPEAGALGLLAVGLAGLLWVTMPARQPTARPSSAKR